MTDAPKAALLGWPAKHSLSPKLHGYWLEKHGIAGGYEALEVSPEALAETVRSLPEKGFRGFNLTVPHKETVMPLLDEADALSAAIGAVNLVTIREGKMRGTNTDAYGFIAGLKERGFPRAKRKAVILGAGGAARAAVKGLADEGFAHIVLANRTVEKAESVAGRMGGTVEVVPWERRAAALENADLLVNATSLGMEGREELEIDLNALPEEAAVADIVYAPLETRLLAAAKARGNPAIDGLSMLMHQAAPAFEAWFGVRPEVDDALRRHLLEGAA